MGRNSKIQEYYEKLREYYFTNKTIPNFQILTYLFGVNSKASVHKIFKQFIDKGIVFKEGNKYYPTSKLLSIPMFESIKAGFPSPATEENKHDIDISSYLIDSPNSTVFLKVHGDSMKDEGIFSGDIVVVDKSIQEKPGHIIVAIVDGDYTMKYLMQDDNGKYFLRAANSEFDDIYPENELEVFGVVTGSFRKYE